MSARESSKRKAKSERTVAADGEELVRGPRPHERVQPVHAPMRGALVRGYSYLHLLAA
jgi:hypothetical protein